MYSCWQLSRAWQLAGPRAVAPGGMNHHLVVLLAVLAWFYLLPLYAAAAADPLVEIS